MNKNKDKSINRLFKEFKIWKPINDKTVICYRCFEILPDEKFVVKSSDFYYEKNIDKDWKQHEDGFHENLFFGNFEMLAREASDSIEEAIEKHEKDFK